jgi:hypothetical protein
LAGGSVEKWNISAPLVEMENARSAMENGMAVA